MNEYHDGEGILREAVAALTGETGLSRRQFLKASGVSIAAIAALGPFFAEAETKPVIIMEQAAGIIIADPARCVGCRRCELACTEFNDGKAHPAISRIKVGRNIAFGPKGVRTGQAARGSWGDGLVVQDTCKQCPHPVPCANACPNDAIIARPPLNARVVDLDRCVGCGTCQEACPWEMISLDPDLQKATKCFLCNGKPKCVEACPASALSYASWTDLTRRVPLRAVPTAVIPPAKAIACNECHSK